MDCKHLNKPLPYNYLINPNTSDKNLLFFSFNFDQDQYVKISKNM